MVTEALGISVGDKVWTSYGSNIYFVKEITAPTKFHKSCLQFVIRDHETIHLVLSDADGKSNTPSYIGNIRRVSSSRWATDMNDEIFVEKTGVKTVVQLDLFAEPEVSSAPDYAFQNNCDYRAGAGKVWHCVRCNRDFNTIEFSRQSVRCPECAASTIPIFFMPAPAPDDRRPYPSEHLVTLNFLDYVASTSV